MKNSLFIPVITAQAASAALIARHEGHDGSSLSLMNNMTRFVYPIVNSTTYVQASSSAGSNNPYYPTNATSTGSWARYGSGLPGPLPSFSAPTVAASTTTSGDGLWPMHWPMLQGSGIIGSTTYTPIIDGLVPMHWPTIGASNSSDAVSPTPVAASSSSAPASFTNSTLATLYPTAPPDQTSSAINIPSTTMTPSTFQAIHTTTLNGPGSHAKPSIPTLNMGDILDPVYFGPTSAQTSTLHITVTANMPKATPSTTKPASSSSLEESTITSKFTSTTIKTIALPSTTLHSPQTAKPSSTMQSADLAIHTTVLSADPRCPYPLPGVYCGPGKTTLVTETRSREGSATSTSASTKESEKPKGSGSCPYPGQKC